MKNYKEILIPLAIKAGEEIMKFYKSDFRTEYKADQSPVTEADIAANKMILEGLKATGLPIISEESNLPDFNIRSKMKTYWLIDPLDGTKQFVNNEGEFTVNIALINDSETIEGVIYAPAIQTLYYGNISQGAFKSVFEKLPESLSDIVEQKLPLVVKSEGLNLIVSKSHLNEKTKAFLDKVKTLKPDLVTCQIGSSLKFCCTAEGNTDLYPRIGSISEWDIAAGHAILKSAGGNVLDLNTLKEVRYNSESMRTPDFVAFLNPKVLSDLGIVK